MCGYHRWTPSFEITAKPWRQFSKHPVTRLCQHCNRNLVPSSSLCERRIFMIPMRGHFVLSASASLSLIVAMQRGTIAMHSHFHLLILHHLHQSLQCKHQRMVCHCQQPPVVSLVDSDLEGGGDGVILDCMRHWFRKCSALPTLGNNFRVYHDDQPTYQKVSSRFREYIRTLNIFWGCVMGGGQGVQQNPKLCHQKRGWGLNTEVPERVTM